MDIRFRLLKTLAIVAFGALIYGCGGAPASNPNVQTAGSGDTPEVNDGVIALKYGSATSELINLKGMGGVESSIITFEVTDSSGNALSGVAINFSLVTDFGVANSVNSARLRGDTIAVQSDSDGRVAITVVSGTNSETATVIATVDGTDITARSVDISISTATPLYDRFSLSMEDRGAKVGTWGVDGESVNITVTASDKVGHTEFNGVSVIFHSPVYGSFDEPSCVFEDGQCSVSWRTGAGQIRTPLSYLLASKTPISLAWDFDDYPSDGRSVPIMAFTQGGEPFTDANNNYVYDVGELFTDLAIEPFIDEDGDDEYDVGEYYFDVNGDGRHQGGNGVYDGPCRGECTGDSTTTIWVSGSITLCPEKELQSFDDPVVICQPEGPRPTPTPEPTPT